jgi:hypothetical protein
MILLGKIYFPLVAVRGVEALKLMPKCEFIDKARLMLIKHFEIGQDESCPKLKDKDILKILSEMRDEDGGLMFCYSKRGSWPRGQLCDLIACSLQLKPFD